MSAQELNNTVLKNSANLKAYYRFESGALTTDSSGNGKTLSVGGTINAAAAKFGSGADFGNSNQHASRFLIFDNFEIAGSGTMSLSFWIKFNNDITSGTVQLARHVSNLTLDRYIVLSYEYNGGTRRLAISLAGTANYYNVTLGTDWHHIVLIRNGTTNAQLYIDGAYKTTVSSFGSGTGGSSYFDIGGDGINLGAAAIFDDFAIFNTALSADQIKELYEGRTIGELWPHGGVNCRAIYHLSNETDCSGNSFHLTNTGTVTFAQGKFGNCADFGTSNTTKLLGIANSLGISGGSCTIGAWIKLRAEIGAGTFTVARQISQTNNVANMIYYEYNSGARRLRFNRSRLAVADDSVFYTITLGTTNWYFLVMTYDNTNVRGYVNGVQVSTPTASSGNGVSGGQSAFGIGASTNDGTTGSNFASAYIDEVFVFANEAKDAAWIRKWYAWSVGKYL